MPKGENLARVLDAASGLTRYEAEGSFRLSLTRKNAIRPEVIWELEGANAPQEQPSHAPSWPGEFRHLAAVV